MAKAVSRRSFLRGVGLGGMAVRIGLPPLAAMFNSSARHMPPAQAPRPSSLDSSSGSTATESSKTIGCRAK